MILDMFVNNVNVTIFAIPVIKYSFQKNIYMLFGCKEEVIKLFIIWLQREQNLL